MGHPTDDVEAVVLRTCAELAGPAAPAPTAATTMKDLGMDSLAAADLAVAVAERFGVLLGDADITSDARLRDVVRVVQTKAPSGRSLPPVLGVAQGLAAGVISGG